MARELRDREVAQEWLGAGLCLMRLATPCTASLELVSPWLVAAQSELGALPPAGVVADFGNVLLGGQRDLSAARSTSAPDLRSALRLYDDQVLGRLASDPKLDSACDAMARLPDELKHEAVAVLLSNLLGRIKYDAGISFNPGITRQLGEKSAELLEKGFARLHQPGEILDALAEGYSSLVRASRHAGSLLTDADIFALENLSVLRTLTQRLAIQQVAEVAEELERTLPRRIRRSNRVGHRTATQIEDEDKYPIGGFSSMSTSGSIENLVTSELIYMDDAEESDGVDLFDLRYVEGELLYYTRDESVFLRNRHVLTFALMAPLAKARFKDPGARWQRLVMVLGLVLCLVRRISEWLNEEGLLFRVVLVGEAKAALAPERELVSLILREWIEKGCAQIDEAPDLAALFLDAEGRARTAEHDVLVLGAGPTELPASSPRVQVLELDFGEPTPAVKGRGIPSEPAEPGYSWDSWTAMLAALVQKLV